MTENYDNDDRQDETQLTAGGTPVAGEFAPGDIVGGTYEVLSFIGAGGMGNVYRVRHNIMQTHYALKTLSAEQVTEVAWRRFQNEAQAIARMSHPNIVAIYNLGLHDGRLPFYVMDLLTGQTLSDILKAKGPLSVEIALPMFIELCAGFGYAHKKGIIHRDIKPPNIVLNETAEPGSGRVKIVDFGIAKLSHTKDLANQQLTGVGEICGSPIYMSPEQCDAGRIDARSDIYSLGCTLFETLTGIPPLKGRNAVDTMLLHHTGVHPSLKTASAGKEFPAKLEAVLTRCLAKAPMDRYQNMESLAADLQAVLKGANQPTPAKASSQFSIPAVASALVGVLILVGGGVYVLTKRAEIKKPDSATIYSDNTKDKPTVPVTVEKIKPISSVETGKDGRQYRVFEFPELENFGVIEAAGQKNTAKICRGKMRWPLSTRLNFFVGGDCFARPELLEGFGPNDLDELTIQSLPTSDERPTTKMLAHIQHLTGLKGIIMIDADWMDNSALSYLETLPHLDKLEMIMVGITPAALAKQPFLKRLRHLSIESKESVSPVLRSLEGSTALQALKIVETNLTKEDYKSIATMSGLMLLEVPGCEITNADLITISNLKNLYRINVSSGHINSEAAPTLKKMHSQGLREVHMLSEFLPESDYKKLHTLGTGVDFK